MTSSLDAYLNIIDHRPASLIHPCLFATIILSDPIIQDSVLQGVVLAFYATLRKDLWPSRAAAEMEFRKAKIYQKWDK